MPTFREWMNANRPWRAAPMPPVGSDPYAYYCPPPRQPMFTPTDKRPGDKVLGAGGKWSVA